MSKGVDQSNFEKLSEPGTFLRHETAVVHILFRASQVYLCKGGVEITGDNYRLLYLAYILEPPRGTGGKKLVCAQPIRVPGLRSGNIC